MLRIALIVLLSIDVWIIEQSKSAKLITYNNDRFAKHFSNLRDLIVVIVKAMDAFQSLVVAQTWT